MPISIQNFRDKFSSGGPTPTNRFEVSFEGNVTRNLFFAGLNDLKFFKDLDDSRRFLLQVLGLQF